MKETVVVFCKMGFIKKKREKDCNGNNIIFFSKKTLKIYIACQLGRTQKFFIVGPLYIKGKFWKDKNI